jgi:YegS/Rv2252/BmrU family lipid kinase
MTDNRKVAVLLNIAAGKADADPQLREIKEAFAEVGIEPKIWQAESGEDLRQAAKEALQLGYPIITAAGGDGTVSTTADALAGSESSLGLLPAGTLNHFAKDLNIDLDIKGAAKTIAEGHAVAVDIGKVNDRYFINNASIGIYPQLLRHRERIRKKGISKWTAFVSALFNVLLESPSSLRVRLNVGEEEIETLTSFIFVGNNEYEITGFHIGIRQQLDAGFLSLYLSRRTTRLGMIGLLFRAVLGRLGKRKEADFDIYRTREFRIDTGKGVLEAALDGELTTFNTPLHFSIQPRSLKVVVKK